MAILTGGIIMKKEINKDYVIILSKDGEIHKVSAERFHGKMKPLYNQYDAEYLLFEVGASTPTYIPIKRKEALKYFTPFKLRYKVISTTARPKTDIFNFYRCEDESVNTVEMWVDTYPKFVSMLSSISSMYMIAFFTTKLDTFNDINTDFEVYNRRLIIGSMEIIIGNSTCMSKSSLHTDIAEIIEFMSSSLDIPEDILLNHSVANPLKDTNYVFRIDFYNKVWHKIDINDISLEIMNKDQYVGVSGVYSTGLIFISGYEYHMLCLLDIYCGEYRMCVYERSTGKEFDEVETDERIDVKFITSHPEEFFVDTLVVNSFSTEFDALSITSLAKEIAMTQSIILERSGVRNAEILIDLDLTFSEDEVSNLILTFDTNDLLYNKSDLVNKFFEFIHDILF